MITLERAAELVSLMQKVDQDAAIDLFCHFDDFFKLNVNKELITAFAVMCGYNIATNIQFVKSL